ncbi:MAG: LapA family protein [Gammaproteobacteria bacterium]|nr:LapA family protein [Gammaproteobacteria bacterium]
MGILLLLVLLGVLLGMDNSEDVSLTVLTWVSPSAPLFLWLCLVFLAGLLLGYAVAGVGTLRARLALRKLARSLPGDRAPS